MTLADLHYNRLYEKMMTALTEVEKFREINSFLRNYEWLFISPFFFQGFELNYFFNLIQTKTATKDKITSTIFKKFYNPSHLASFVEGYCTRCASIEPFSISIETSIILSLQREYEGAIKTIIPIVEGILRRYLVAEKKQTNSSIGFRSIKNSIVFLKEDILESYNSYLESYFDENKQAIKFSISQIESLINVEREYYDIWFSFLSDFIDGCFYLDSRKNPILNQPHRHSILHEFGVSINYNLENFIKVYFVIQFLTWIFLIKERKSLLNGISDKRFTEKTIAYSHLIAQSELLTKTKILLYDGHTNFDSTNLTTKLPITSNRLENTLPKRLRMKFIIKIFNVLNKK